MVLIPESSERSDMRESEPEGARPRPETPYQAGSQVLRVPRSALARALEVFQQAAQRECCCFWYGVRDGADVISEVRAVIIPRQRQARRNYLVPVDAMRDVQRRAGPLGMVNLAQLHSHPGPHVDHSLYDDEMANSRRALSVVVPNYGHWRNDWPSGVGIHEFQAGFWHRLDDALVQRRVAIVDGPEATLIDCR
jgi:proteasome lid subunit RPN8/RPN11